jgi:DNA-binding protein
MEGERINDNRMNDNSIFVGGKPFMNYVTGVVMQFTTKNADEVIIKARGKFISRAVDVAEVAAKRFLEATVQIMGIKIDSEEFTNKEGRKVRVSTIEITLAKK